MRALIAILIALRIAVPALLAQEAAQPAAQAKPEAAKTEEVKPAEEAKPAAEAKPAEEAKPAAEAAPAAAAQSPVPAAEPEHFASGSIDFGYRWLDFTGGSFQAYRSIVNLGEGLKLFGADITLQNPDPRLFDRLDIRMNNWGGDPYNTLNVGVRKSGVYDFRASYRNIIYYDFLPSFADPTIAQGIFLNQRSYDIHRRMSEFQLDLRPGKRVIPYLAYDRSGNSGRGITTFVSQNDEFPVTNQIRDAMDNYRGGVRVEMRRWHLTLEQGGTVLKDDEQVFTSDRNQGNVTGTYLGQQLFLTSLQQAYGVRGHSIYSKVLASGSPATWINVFGQFMFSQPQNDVHYSQNNAGNFVSLNPLLFYGAQQQLFSGVAKMPHANGSAGAEVRPFRRLRILEAWMTDRLHDASFGVLTGQLLQGSTTVTPDPLASGNLLSMNYNQQEINAFFDVTSKITLRGGHRYVWGDGFVPGSLLTPLGERGQLKRQVGIGGVQFRTGGKLSGSAEFEGASASQSYFYTSLHDYQWLRARARYQAIGSLAFSADFGYLNNENPLAANTGMNYTFRNVSETLSAYWTPGGSKRVSLLAEYSRQAFNSDINYLDPGTLTPVRSLYRDNAHAVNGMLDVNLPPYGGGLAAKLSFGGSMYLSSGSRPTNFYQPVGRLLLPLHKHVASVTEWRYYGFGEPFYQYESFRSHLFTTGLRLTR